MPRYYWVILGSFLVSITGATGIVYLFIMQSQAQFLSQFAAVHEMSGKVTQLSQRLAQMEKEQAMIAAEIQMMRNVPEKTDTPVDVKILENAEKSSGALPVDRRSELLAMLKTEAIDSQWSIAAEQEISSALAENPVRTKYVSDPQCRSRYCWLEITYEDPTQADLFVEKLSEKLNWPNSSMEIYYKNDRKDTDLFLFRGATP